MEEAESENKVEREIDKESEVLDCLFLLSGQNRRRKHTLVLQGINVHLIASGVKHIQ